MKAVVVGFLASICAGGAANAAPEWTGKWAFDLAWCSNTAETTDAVPIFLTDTELAGYENTCDIINHEPLAVDGGYLLNLSCSAEGETFDENMLVLVEGGNTLFLYREGPSMTKFKRCE